MRLNKEIAAERLLVGMFRRKSAANAEGEVCPYCEFVNKPNSSICAQCYYELNKSPRDQGEPVSVEVERSLPGGDSERPDIIFISIDSLRADHLSSYGYFRKTSPFIDELAESGVRFNWARSTSPWTLPSHMTMFSGFMSR